MPSGYSWMILHTVCPRGEYLGVGARVARPAAAFQNSLFPFLIFTQDIYPGIFIFIWIEASISEHRGVVALHGSGKKRQNSGILQRLRRPPRPRLSPRCLRITAQVLGINEVKNFGLFTATE